MSPEFCSFKANRYLSFALFNVYQHLYYLQEHIQKKYYLQYNFKGGKTAILELLHAYAS